MITEIPACSRQLCPHILLLRITSQARAEALVPGAVPVLSLCWHTRSLVKSEVKITPHKLFLEVPAGCCAQRAWGLFSWLRILSPCSLSFAPPLQRWLSTLGLLSPSPALNSDHSLGLVIS